MDLSTPLAKLDGKRFREAIAMDATEILDQFTHAEGLPREAL